MSIREHKSEIENLLKKIFQEKNEMIKNVVELSNYIDPEVFDISHEEDKNVCDNIQKRVDFLANLVIEKLKIMIDGSENIDFKISKKSFPLYNPICYIYGFKPSSKEDNFKFPKLHVNLHVENENAFIILFDLTKCPKLLPWK